MLCRGICHPRPAEWCRRRRRYDYWKTNNRSGTTRQYAFKPRVHDHAVRSRIINNRFYYYYYYHFVRFTKRPRTISSGAHCRRHRRRPGRVLLNSDSPPPYEHVRTLPSGIGACSNSSVLSHSCVRRTEIFLVFGPPWLVVFSRSNVSPCFGTVPENQRRKPRIPRPSQNRREDELSVRLFPSYAPCDRILFYCATTPLGIGRVNTSWVRTTYTAECTIARVAVNRCTGACDNNRIAFATHEGTEELSG